MQDTLTADCLIVGAGPAGLTAAIYLRRFLREVVLIDHGHSRAMAIEHTGNYPGFAQGLSGHELLKRLREQLAGVRGRVTTAEVKQVQRLAEGGFAVQCGGHTWQTCPQWQTWHARTLVLATGVVDGVPDLPGIEALQQRGLLRQCPVCDGFEHSEHRIVVLGDGEHAAREASFIAHFSPHVALVGLSGPPPKAEPSAPADLQPGARGDVRTLSALAARVDLPAGGGVRVGLTDGSSHDFDVAYAALPAKPRASLGLALGAEQDAQGSLVVDTHGATCVPGLYAAGDVVSGLDQLVVAAAQGAVAATAIHNLLRAAKR